MADISEHVQKINITVEMITGSHPAREGASSTFRDAVKQIHKAGHCKCWICGTSENLQAHHYGCEWSEQENCDYDKLTEVNRALDFYGFNAILAEQGSKITSVDQKENLVILCQKHHTGTDHETDTGTSIHNMPLGWWLMQKIGKIDPIPQNGQSIEDVEKLVK